MGEWYPSPGIPLSQLSEDDFGKLTSRKLFHSDLLAGYIPLQRNLRLGHLVFSLFPGST